MTEEAREAADEITVQSVRSSLYIARRRFDTLAKTEGLSAQAVMRELAETIVPALEDTTVLVDRVEQGVIFAQEEIERIDEGAEPEPESQLLPHDAARYTNYLEAIIDQSEASLKGIDPASEHAKALMLMASEGRALLKLTNEITLVPRPDDGDDEDDGDDDEDDDDGASSGNGADG